MFPKVFQVGDFFLPTYGLMMVLAFLAGLWLAERLARRNGLNAERIADLAIYCALVGLLGAKLLMFVFDWDYYARNPEVIFSLSTFLSAGVYYGGFLSAVAFAWFYVKKHQMAWLPTADTLAPAVALGHGIGRLGCFFAGCCWGARCDSPWAVTFTSKDAHELTGVPLGHALHPTQLYESALTFAVAWLLYRLSVRPHAQGTVFGWYLVLYAIVRIFAESFREHDQALPFGLPLTWTQWIAVVLLIAGMWLLRRARITSPARQPS